MMFRLIWTLLCSLVFASVELEGLQTAGGAAEKNTQTLAGFKQKQKSQKTKKFPDR